MKIAVVDDEKIFIKSFFERLEKYIQNGIDELYMFDNSLKFLNSDTIYDLVFLDIDMPGIEGITVAKNRINTGEKLYLCQM